MSTNANAPADVDLSKIERAVWMRCYEDGLMEIFLGLMLLLMGSGSVFIETYGMSERGAILLLLVMATATFVLFYVGKRLVTFPRIGRVKFGPKGKARMKKTTIMPSRLHLSASHPAGTAPRPKATNASVPYGINSE